VASGKGMPQHGYQVVWDRNETSVAAPCVVSHAARPTSVSILNVTIILTVKMASEEPLNDHRTQNAEK